MKSLLWFLVVHGAIFSFFGPRPTIACFIGLSLSSLAASLSAYDDCLFPSTPQFCSRYREWESTFVPNGIISGHCFLPSFIFSK
jgi:hypothetical protein